MPEPRSEGFVGRARHSCVLVQQFESQCSTLSRPFTPGGPHDCRNSTSVTIRLPSQLHTGRVLSSSKLAISTSETRPSVVRRSNTGEEASSGFAVETVVPSLSSGTSELGCRSSIVRPQHSARHLVYAPCASEDDLHGLEQVQRCGEFARMRWCGSAPARSCTATLRQVGNGFVSDRRTSPRTRPEAFKPQKRVRISGSRSARLLRRAGFHLHRCRLGAVRGVQPIHLHRT